MEHNVHSNPGIAPSKIGVILFVLFWINQAMAMINHNEINMWIATVVGLITLGKYMYEFNNFLKRRKSKKQ
jgi:hypothetical protein